MKDGRMNNLILLVLLLSAVIPALSRHIEEDVVGVLEDVEDKLDDVIDKTSDVLSETEHKSTGADEVIEEELELVKVEAKELKEEVSETEDDIVDGETGKKEKREDVEELQEDAAIMMSDMAEAVLHNKIKSVMKNESDKTGKRLKPIRKDIKDVLKDLDDVQRLEKKHKKHKTKPTKANKYTKGTKKGQNSANSTEMMSNDVPIEYLRPGPLPWGSDPYRNYPLQATPDEKEWLHRDQRINGNYYDSSGLKVFLDSCADCVEITNNYECPLNDEVLEMKKWARELQELLSFGCNKPGECKGSGRCCISKKMLFEETVVQMTQMLKDIYHMFRDSCSNKCCVTPEWSNWSPWSQCSATCGRGQETRSRTCPPQPSPLCTGTCIGQPTEIRDCYSGNDVDGNWSQWTRWTTCSATCGGGYRERERSCVNPPPGDCGQMCPGVPVESEPCNEKDCCVDGNWGTWTYWSECSVSCGPGEKSRTRECNNPAPNFCGQSCNGPAYSNMPCVSGDRVDGNWSPWNRWSSCSRTCGGGVRERVRTCTNPRPNGCGNDCPGYDVDTDRCNEHDCCVDGNWSPWNRWSSCSRTCGGGERNRFRTCTNPRPNNCGQPCLGSDNEDEGCNHQECCVDGNWSQWNPWATCSRTCGGGVRGRTRTCTNPSPNHCGNTCPGVPVTTQTCNDHPCCVPQDGGWTPWTRWTTCSRSCGGGERTRTRSCSSPPTNACGRPCPGLPVDTERCNHQHCCVPQHGDWTPWTRWGPCSRSCDGGMRERTRSCTSPPPNECGRPCPGIPMDTERCNQHGCCVPQHGDWTPWTRWSPCSRSCDGGMRERTRSCTSPPPNECGRPCPGIPLDSERCNQHGCCVPQHGEWTPWTRWTPCSRSCDGGMRERTRSCTSPSPNQCGRPCPGTPMDTERCNQHSCCVPQHGVWSQWTQWTQCSRSCGGGDRSRSRTCSPQPNECGSPCQGTPYDTERCNLQNCCEDGIWGTWTAWSSCTVTCGSALVERRRTCSQPSSCGLPCEGLDRDMRPVTCGPEPQDGGWSLWGSWSQCSATCETGRQFRRKVCNSPYPNACGRPCEGLDEDVRTCDTGISCTCVDGGWSTWGQWSRCSATCGEGQQYRRKVCNNPYPDACGQPCQGRDEDVQTCNSGVPCECELREWTQWQPWTQCPTECGQAGRRTRDRHCVTVRPGRNCANDCPGDPIQEELCPVIDCEPSVEWSSWDTWCLCDCSTGRQYRARTCVEHITNRKVSVSLCHGPAREEQYCDVRDVCPGCVSDCSNKEDGDYASCTDCSAYVTCRNHRMQPMINRCSFANTEWDSFVEKCVKAPSPTCSLVDCVQDCSGVPDGYHPSCRGCGWFIECNRGTAREEQCPRSDMEWNHHAQRCEVLRSPTCQRTADSFLFADAPADHYYDEKNGLSPEKRHEQYEMRRLEALEKLKSGGNDSWRVQSSGKQTLEDQILRIMIRKKNEKRVPDCVESCDKVKPGLYPSCAGCKRYVICTKHGKLRSSNCRNGRHFDNKKKKCVRKSSTCPVAKP